MGRRNKSGDDKSGEGCALDMTGGSGTRANLKMTLGRLVLVFTCLFAAPVSSFAKPMECKFHTRHTCYQDQCKSEAINNNRRIEFEVYGSKLKSCYLTPEGMESCEDIEVKWIEQKPRLAVTTRKKQDGTTISGDIFSYEPSIYPTIGWLIVPALGGVGVLAGTCSRIE